MKVQDATRARIKAILRIVQTFRKMDSDLPPQYIETFLLVALHEPITQTDLAARIGVSQSSTSRAVGVLGSYGRRVGDKQYPGLQLVMSMEDPTERRRKIVRLAPRGHALAKELAEEITAAAG